jgi:hypothetical protein
MNKIEAIQRQREQADKELADARRAVEVAESWLRRLKEAEQHALSDTLVAPGGEPAACTGCGADVHTERLFSEHYVIPDWRYYNLGYCPIKGRTENV